MIKRPYPNHRQAALALLNGDFRLNPYQGRFLGQIVFDASPLTAKQSAWLAGLLDRADLPPLAEEGAK